MKPKVDSVLPIVKTPTHIRGLDTILNGGLPVGRTTLLAGTAGTGKTVLAMEFIYRGALAGEPAVFVSFEEREEDLRANAQSMGMDLRRLEEAGLLRIVYAAVPHGAVRSGQFDLKGLLAALTGLTAEIGARRLALDAIDVLIRIFDDPRREREELYILHDWVRRHGLTTLLTAKAGSEAALLYPFLDYMADCVLLLDQRMDEQVRTRRLNVVKYRGSGFLGNEHPYLLGRNGAVFLPVSAASLVQADAGRRIPSGSETFDRLLGGGYWSGSCILMAGPSGAGKSTLASLFAKAACQHGGKVLYVNYEQAADAVVRAMAGVGIDLQPFMDSGRLIIQTAMPESAGVERHLLEILETLEQFAPDHLIIDSISAFERMGSQQAAFDLAVRLLTACRDRGITCFYTNQARQPSEVMEIVGHGISSLIDTLVALSYDDDGTQLTRRLIVVKSRGGPHSMRYHGFEITDHGIVFADPQAEGRP